MKIAIGELKSRANHVLDSVQEFDTVRVASLECWSHHPVLDGPFNVLPELGVRSSQSTSNDRIDVWARYQLQANTGSDDVVQAWGVTVEIVGSWVQNQTQKFDSLDLECFAMAIGAMALHPYAREAVQSTVGRLGYPPYTMELLTPLTAGPDENEIELDDSASNWS